MSGDLRERLAEADPIRVLGDLRMDEERCHDAVRTIVADADVERPAPRRPLVVVVRVVTAVATLAAVLVVALVVRPLSSGDGASPAARTVLAASVRNAADAPASGRDYWEVTTRSPDRDATRTEWVAVDGSRPTVIREEHGGRSVAWTSDLAPDRIEGSFLNPTPSYLRSLPRDPGALREVIERIATGHGPSLGEEVFTVVVDLLRSGIVPADLRRALFLVLEGLPGVDVTPTGASSHDTSVLTMRQAASGQAELMIDTATGTVMGTRVGGGAWSTVSVEIVPQVPPSVRDTAVVARCTALAGSGMTCTGLPPDQP